MKKMKRKVSSTKRHGGRASFKVRLKGARPRVRAKHRA